MSTAHQNAVSEGQSSVDPKEVNNTMDKSSTHANRDSQNLVHSKADGGMDSNHHSLVCKGDRESVDDYSCHEESGILVESERSDVSFLGQDHDVTSGDCSLPLGQLKKDDSGLYIDGEKSPSSAKDSSDLEMSECACDTQTDSGALSRTNSASDSSNPCKTSHNTNSSHLEATSRAKHSSDSKKKDKRSGDADSKVKVLEDKDAKGNANCDKDGDMGIVINVPTGENCDRQEENEITDCMPVSLDTEDSDPIGSYDVAMATASNSDDDDEQKSELSKIRKNFRLKGKRKYRVPRVKSDSDTESDTTENADASSAKANKIDDMDDSESGSDFSEDHFDDVDDDNDDDDERKKKTDDKKTDSEEEEEEEDDKERSLRHTWKALYDLRSREYGSNNRTPPAIFREKVHGSVQMVQRFKLQYKMEYHDGCVNALHFNRIGTLLASGSDDLNIVLWNWMRNRPALVYDSGHRSNVFQAKFMPFSGDCHVVSCARDGQVRLGELSLTGVCKGTKKLAQHKGAAHKLALELDSPHVFLSCGEDAMVYEIDLRQDKPNKLVQTKEKESKVPLYSINSNPINSFEFCVGGRDHFIRVYDKRKISDDEGGLVKKYCPHKLVDSSSKANVTCAVYSYNGAEILGSYNDDDIYLFSNAHSDGADYIHRYSGHRNNATVKGVNFYGPHSEFVVSGSDCGHIYLWDTETEDVVQFLPGDEGGVINVLEPHPFAPVLATSGLDHDVKVWAPTQEEPTTLTSLRKTMKQNKKEREEERLSEPRALEDMIDGHMLYYLMRQIHRARRRNEPDEEGSSSSSSEFDSDDSEEPPNRINCAQS